MKIQSTSYRWLRWALLVIFALIAFAVGIVYRAKRMEAKAGSRALPPAVSLDTRASAQEWEWGQSAEGKPAVKLKAKEFRQAASTNKAELKGIELRIYAKDGKHYHRVRSDYAEFSTDTTKLFAPGEAEITLDVPSEGEPLHSLTTIKAAGINFDSQTGQAVTDKHVEFTFEGGDGTCTGAAYDPQTHQLQLNNDVTLNLHGKGKGSKPMKVETGQLTYNEADALVHLGPWSRMNRDQTLVNAAVSVVKMVDKKMRAVDADHASGSDKRPGREIEYAADKIHVEYNEDGEMEKMNGAGNAKLISHGKGSNTTMMGNTVDLFFNTETGESVLASARAAGGSSVESKPTPDPKGNTGDTKLLKSDSIDLHMKADGRELDRVNTKSAGVLEFLPNQATRHRRVLKASEMDIRYGARSEIQSFHAVAATTETYPSDDDRRKKKPNLAVAYTSSKVMDAAFNADGQVRQMKQVGDFRYTEAMRKAQADTATLENDTNVMNLETHARIADDAGSTAADHIQINQNTGDFDARGHVSTTRLPDEKKASSDMLDKSQPTQGLADRVTSANRNRAIRYIGNAVLWQASNRIQADTVDIDREKKSIVADGKVISQFEESPKPIPGSKKPPPAPIVTIVRAPHLIYTDADRVAVYSGGSDFRRPLLSVKSTTLTAYLNDDKSDEDSRINHALADGKVEIVDVAKDRRRVGNSEHAEYYADEGKIVLSGGEPHLKDSLRGDTRGDKLTYFTEDDKLIVDGAPGPKPNAPRSQAQTHLVKKKR